MGRLHGDKEEKLIRSGLEVEGKDDQGNVLLGASDFIYACVKEGAKELVILPYFLASGNHVARDIPEIVEKMQKAYPEVRMELKEHIGSALGMVTLLRDMAVS